MAQTTTKTHCPSTNAGEKESSGRTEKSVVQEAVFWFHSVSVVTRYRLCSCGAKPQALDFGWILFGRGVRRGMGAEGGGVTRRILLLWTVSGQNRKKENQPMSSAYLPKPTASSPSPDQHYYIYVYILVREVRLLWLLVLTYEFLMPLAWGFAFKLLIFLLADSRVNSVFSQKYLTACRSQWPMYGLSCVY